MHLLSENDRGPQVKALQAEMTVMLQSVTCHHVCRYLGVVKIQRKFCIVMELYKESLRAYIERQPGE